MSRREFHSTSKFGRHASTDASGLSYGSETVVASGTKNDSGQIKAPESALDRPWLTFTVGKVSTAKSVQNFSHFWVVPSTFSTDTF